MEASKIQDFNGFEPVAYLIPHLHFNLIIHSFHEPVSNEGNADVESNKLRVQTPLKSWIFQAAIRNC